MLESVYCRAGLVIGILIGSATGQFNPVAFTVGQDSHFDVQRTSYATVIPFRKEITNNKAVNLNAGVFTCTEAGLYKFQMYALTKSNTKVFLELYQNDVLVASLWGHTPNDYAAAGNAVVLSLEVGDVVKVMSRSRYDVSVYGTPNEVYTTFTVVQLGSHTMYSECAELPAFSVSLRQHQGVPAGTAVLYDTVRTDTVRTDVNSAYNVKTGVYKVPTHGVYIFHFFSLAAQNQALWQELYRNNQYICSIYGMTDQDWADAGNTVILHLKAGDEITIRANNSNNLYGTADQIYSTFSGAQLATNDNLNSIKAFSVGLSHNSTVSSSNKVIFDWIFINLNQAYNQVTGEFKAPVSGLYEFNYHALGKNGKIWLELFHKDRYVDSLYSHTTNNYATAGNAAVLELDLGDVVFVKAHIDQDLYGASNEIYCTFSGYLLYARGSNTYAGK